MSASPHAVAFAPEKGAAARRARAQETRRGPRLKKVALAGLRFLSAIVLSAALGLGAVQGVDWARRSPLFAVRAVVTRGNVHAASGELIARSGLLVGQNLFRVDLAAAARGVESSPWVISASVSRQLPTSIEIEVREHTPAARVQLGGLYFSDASGLLFKKVADDDDAAARALPVLTGLSRADWDEHREATLARLRLGLQLVADWAANGFDPAELGEVRAESDGAFVAVARQGGLAQEIRVGKGPFAANLHRLARVRLELQRRGAQSLRIDLDNPARPDEVAAQIAHPDDHLSARPKGHAHNP